MTTPLSFWLTRRRNQGWPASGHGWSRDHHLAGEWVRSVRPGLELPNILRRVFQFSRLRPFIAMSKRGRTLMITACCRAGFTREYLCAEIDRGMERRANVMVKRSMSSLVFSLWVVSLMGLKGCDRQAPLPKAVKELPQVPDTAVGEMARSVIYKAKEVETTLEEAGNRTAETSKDGTP